jgi:hypothetical protein
MNKLMSTDMAHIPHLLQQYQGELYVTSVWIEMCLAACSLFCHYQ